MPLPIEFYLIVFSRRQAMLHFRRWSPGDPRLTAGGLCYSEGIFGCLRSGVTVAKIEFNPLPWTGMRCEFNGCFDSTFS